MSFTRSVALRSLFLGVGLLLVCPWGCNNAGSDGGNQGGSSAGNGGGSGTEQTRGTMTAATGGAGGTAGQ